MTGILLHCTDIYTQSVGAIIIVTMLFTLGGVGLIGIYLQNTMGTGDGDD